MPPSPYLDIVATTDAEDIDASVNLSGTVNDPEISFSSTPALPEDEVVSRILFGENLQDITPLQAIRLKRTMDRFTGRGGSGLDPLGALRDLAGVDDINVDTDEEGETSVGVGKYLSDDVYLEIDKGAGEDSGAAKLQVEITPDVTVESEVGQDAQAGAGVFWRWDY
jgi:translocation and assembly module TamB